MTSSYLLNGKINIGRLQEYFKSQLVSLLDKCYGPKVIVWDTGLQGPMGLIANKSLLQEHDAKRYFKLLPGRLPATDVQHIIFITRPQLSQMDIISEIVRTEPKASRSSKEYHIFFVPRKSLLCLKRLEVNGVKGNFSFEEFPCYLYPFDSDVMSLEMESAFKDYYLENDPSCLYEAAQSLMVLQNLYGTIPHITTIGPASQRISELLKRLAEENACYEENPRNMGVPQQIDQLILLDRIVDLISPLATQLTYEGLLDETFSIRNGIVQLPLEHFAQDDGDRTVTDEKKLLILNSGEELFAEIRDKNFSAIGPALSKKAKMISSQISDLNRDKSVQEMKDYVSRLPYMLATKKSLGNHTTIAELLKKETDSEDFLDSLHIEQEFLSGIVGDKSHPHIEEAIARKRPLTKVLRLMCLQSLTNSGLRPKVLEFYKREILQTYGFKHILTLTNLEKAGLLRLQQSSRPYTVLRKALRLTVEDVSEINPTDISYVHSVYAPLSVRLVQNLSKITHSRGLSDVQQQLPGPVLDEVRPSTTTNVEYIVVTTKLINGNSFLQSLSEPLGQGYSLQ